MSHEQLDRAIRLSETQHGVVGRHQLRALGLTRSAIDNAGGGPGWQPVTDEVLVRTGAPDTTARRLMVALIDAGPGAVLSHESAASWWGLRGCSAAPIQLVRSTPTRRPSGLAVVHRVRSLPIEWTTVLDGVPIVRPETVAMHLFATFRPERAERLVDSLWAMRLLSGQSVLRFLESMGRRGRNGIGGLRSYAEVRGPHYVPPATGIEGRFGQIVAEYGIEMRRQIDSGGANWTGRVDFRHLTAPYIVEIQSARHHAALVDSRADAARIAQLESDGFLVREITDDQVWQRPGWVARTVVNDLASLEL